MHISDGIINTPVCLAAHAVAAVAIYVSGKSASSEEIPRMGMTGAALFVVSLLQFPIAGASIHLGLFGLAGIILGRRSFPVVFTVLLIQSLIFQYGGLLTLGINAINMGSGAFLAWLIWRYLPISVFGRAFIAGISGILVPGILMAIEFRLSGYGSGIYILLLIYLVTALIEGGITFVAVNFFRKVKPDILQA
jgi:cobalt/nickel transport system permease protein